MFLITGSLIGWLINSKCYSQMISCAHVLPHHKKPPIPHKSNQSLLFLHLLPFLSILVLYLLFSESQRQDKTLDAQNMSWQNVCIFVSLPPLIYLPLAIHFLLVTHLFVHTINELMALGAAKYQLLGNGLWRCNDWLASQVKWLAGHTKPSATVSPCAWRVSFFPGLEQSVD